MATATITEAGWRSRTAGGVDRALAGEAIYSLTTQVAYCKDTRVADGSIQFRGDHGPKGSYLLAHDPTDLRHYPERQHVLDRPAAALS